MYCSRCGTQNDDTSKFCRSCGLDLSVTTPVRAVQAEQQELTETGIVRDQLSEEYEILEELGRGGMAIVFKAKERQLDREVAIKVLPFSLAFDKEFVERFQREARTSAKLEHPNIIPIYRVGKTGRVIYFIMKFLRGKPLSSVLAARGALPPPEIRQILAQVGSALAYAHKKGIVHRDIKPDNIMFDEHGQAVVTDFGIAKAATGGKLTGTGMSIGTPHYMSPEQARAQQLDGRSDLYSLGVVGFQCLTGSVPFDGEDSFSIGYKHIMEELPTPPLETGDQRDLFEIIKIMMAKLPENRFQTADELVEALTGGAMAAVGLSTAPTRAIPSLSRARLAGAPTTPLPRSPAAPAQAGPAAPPAVRPEAEPKRSVAAALGIWLLIVGSLVGGGGFYAYKQGWLLASGAGNAVRPAPDSAALAADTGARSRGGGADTTGAAADTGAPASRDTSGGRVPPAGAPGKLVLQGVPQGARVSLDGQPVRGTQFDVPPGSHRLVVRAAGFATFERQVVILPGELSTIRVELETAPLVGTGPGGPCDQFGPAYNQDNLCFDSRPVPLSLPVIPVPADAPIFPRAAVLLIKVSRDGQTLEARVFAPSNIETFNNEALDKAKSLLWSPAQKNGEPVEAWVQTLFQPVRQ